MEFYIKNENARKILAERGNFQCGRCGKIHDIRDFFDFEYVTVDGQDRAYPVCFDCYGDILAEQEEQEEAYRTLHKDELLDAIKRAFEAGQMDLYSDMFKDYFGHRPHGQEPWW